MAENRSATQPLAAHEFTRSLDFLRCAPIELTADNLRCAQHARGTRAWSARQRDTAECVCESSDLLGSRSVNQLRLCDRVAPADHATNERRTEHLACVR